MVINTTPQKLVSGGLAITLVDLRSPIIQDTDQRNNIQLVAGDFYHGQTQKEVRQFLDQNESTGFALIVCRPALGWGWGENDSPSPCLTWIAIKKLFSWLEVGGELFFALPLHVIIESEKGHFISKLCWQNWIATCNKNNISVSHSQMNGVLRITKLSADAVLPRLQI